jgi:hypothetical protein
MIICLFIDFKLNGIQFLCISLVWEFTIQLEKYLIQSNSDQGHLNEIFNSYLIKFVIAHLYAKKISNLFRLF